MTALVQIKDRTDYAISLDPGINAMGYVVWNRKFWGQQRNEILLAGVPKTRTTATYHSRVHDLLRQLTHDLRMHLPGKGCGLVICETMIHFGGAKGAAVAKKGGLAELAFATGAIAAWAWERQCEFFPAPSGTWQGQLNKERQNDRVEKKLGRELKHLTLSFSHDWSAAGIGLWAQGRF